MKKILLATFVLAFGASYALAQGRPPMRTDDPGTPGNGNVEINVALGSERGGSERFAESPILDLNYGVGERIQLNFQVAYEVHGTNDAVTQTGLSNSSAAVKWRFVDNKALDLRGASVLVCVEAQCEGERRAETVACRRCTCDLHNYL